MGDNGNQAGDYLQMAGEGDRVVGAFRDTRLGDPDVFVDASVHSALAMRPGMASAASGQDTTIEFRLANRGNYARELAWRVEDTARWLRAGLPATAGSTTLAVGETLVVRATLHLANCADDSTLLSLIDSDPAIPGSEDTCTTVVKCRAGAVTGVDVPAPAVFALEHVEPNPSPDAWSVTFSMPAAGPAKLEVFDVAGRRVLARDLGALGSGRHRARLAEARALSDGVYALRLTAGARTAVRFVVKVQ